MASLDNIFEKNYPLDEEKTLKFAQKMNSIIENKEDYITE